MMTIDDAQTPSPKVLQRHVPGDNSCSRGFVSSFLLFKSCILNVTKFFLFFKNELSYFKSRHRDVVAKNIWRPNLCLGRKMVNKCHNVGRAKKYQNLEDQDETKA